MAQLTLPNSIDAGTPVAAAEVQGNFVAIRDLINGNLEGGATSDGNIKANSLTAREMNDTILPNGLWHGNQAGVFNSGDLKVTPGAGLVLNYAAGSALVIDSTNVVTALLGALVPVSVAGSSVTIGANASGNPRIDQVVLTMTGWYTGTVSVVAGTPTGGATLDNRSGAAALPANSIRLADILMPNAFAGPFVQNTHIRDRRPWARGAVANWSEAGNISLPNTFPTLVTGSQIRIELSGAPVMINVDAPFTAGVTGGRAWLGIRDETAGLIPGGNDRFTIAENVVGQVINASFTRYYVPPFAGSRVFALHAFEDNAATNISLVRPQMTIVEFVQGAASNTGA